MGSHDPKVLGSDYQIDKKMKLRAHCFQNQEVTLSPVESYNTMDVHIQRTILVSIPLLRGVRGVFFYPLLNNTQHARHVSLYI